MKKTTGPQRPSPSVRPKAWCAGASALGLALALAPAAQAAPDSGASGNDAYAAAPPRPRIVSIQGDHVVVAVTPSHRWPDGGQVEFLKVTETPNPDFPDFHCDVEVVVGTGVIVGHKPSEVLVRVDPGPPLSLGLRARPKPAPRRAPSDVAATPSEVPPPPPPKAHRVDLRLSLRPFFGLANGAGAGLLADAEATLHLAGPLFVRLQGEPLGGATGERSDATAGGLGFVGLDFGFASVALGSGVARYFGVGVDGGIAPLAAAQVRFGTEDGGHLRLDNVVVFGPSEVGYARLGLSVQVPVGDRAWLLGQGRLGGSGFGYLEAGAKMRVSGDGGAGSHYAALVAGVAGVGDFGDSGNIGPHVGVQWGLRL